MATALLAVGVAVPAAEASAPAPASAVVVTSKLPKCRVADDLTRYRKLKHWGVTLVDHTLRLPKKYAPKDLVPVSRAKVAGSGSVRKIIVKDLRAMAKAARKAGAAFAVRSAYRSYASQKATFASWQRRLGYAGALKASARAGHSEHQLGTTIDLRAAGSSTSSFSAFGKTKAGRWVAKHAWKYGFVMSYPEGETDKTCYKFEPWHFRYVGKGTAKAVRKSGLTLREYLWREHHQPKKKAKSSG
ncbi:MAG: M15 family metallopeptidase [Actinomycetales bacterium]|nr:M15 family metallopeptidase [Actinomycetales bacterium]